MRINIQSMTPTLLILQSELQQYDIVILTETWLTNKIPNDDILIPNIG
jgi:hypothetical protein